MYINMTYNSYRLDVSLPYPVDENDGSARFDKGTRRLIVTLPVLAVASLKMPFTGESFRDAPLVLEENGNDQGMLLR